MREAFMALILIEKGILKTGDECEIEINGSLRKGRIIKTPFYKNT
jgi:glycine cleavage system aminomethyltransferase T